MTETLAGFPFWEIGFNDVGKAKPANRVERLLKDLPQQPLTDLCIFSHGWNNDRPTARALYERFFGEMRGLLDDPSRTWERQATIGTVGVIWPSTLWADEPPPLLDEGGLASLAATPSDAQLVTGLKPLFKTARQRRALDELARLLEARPSEMAALERFQELMRQVAIGKDAIDAPEDSGERRGLLQDEPREVFERFAQLDATDDEGGAAGLGDVFDRLWGGAKQALRQLTYFEMKKRAGVVGKQGLGPLIGRIQATRPDLHVHLLGHSFGARLVSFSLAGLPETASGTASPVKSVFLLQGAFSHFAFADSLPHDARRGGGLAGMAARVDGPIFVSHSVHDSAVGKFYPLASLASNDDAAAFEDNLFRWAAMGADGAQAVNAAALSFGPIGQAYPFTAGTVVNLNGDDLITAGPPPSGAHGDIFYPQIAWAALTAMGVAKA